MKRVLIAALTALVTAGALVVPSAAPAGAATVLARPTGVKVTPGSGSVTVSWAAVGAGVTYTVTSVPAGLSCTTTTTSCPLTDTVSTPYTFSVVASAPGDTSSPPSAATPALKPHLVLVVAGQSNANGFESYPVDPVTGVNYFAAPYVNGADTHDLLTWEPWSVLQGAGANPVPLDTPQQITGTSGPVTIFGPEIGLARQLWTDTGRSVTIVKTAYEGTSLAVNWNPAKTGTAPDGLFVGMVNDVDRVLAADAAAGQFDVLGGVYWYQGESDATKAGWAKKYQAHLTTFIADVRADLPLNPSAPFAIAEQDISQYIGYLDVTTPLSSGKDAGYLSDNATVRAADVAVAVSVPHTYLVDTLGLSRVAPLDIHLDNVAELALGQQLAKVTESHLP